MSINDDQKTELFDAIFDNSTIGIILLDMNRNIIDINERISSFCGYSKEDLIGKSSSIFHISENSYINFGRRVETAIKEKQNVSIDYPFEHKDGTRIWGHTSGNPLQFPDKLLWMISDITTKKNLESSLTSEKNYMQTLLDGIDDPVIVISTDYNITHMNAASKKRVIPEFIENLHQPKCYEVSHHRNTPCDAAEHPCPLADVLESKGNVKVIHTHPDLNGVDKQVELIAKPFFDEDNNVAGIIETAHDVTDYLEAQGKLHKQKEALDHKAHHDDLTGLPTRELFLQRLKQAMEHAEQTATCVAVVFIDCDNFKEINDNYGHEIGDEILRHIAERIKSNLRFSDSCSRLGGDEFTLALSNIKEVDNISAILNKLRKDVGKTLDVKGHTLNPTLSIGVSMFPLHGDYPDELLKKADVAMYQSKQAGRDRLTFFEE
jgi:diguanylate cyclase (GGDEF)-like protein/PAS domain S-box-containing protein